MNNKNYRLRLHRNLLPGTVWLLILATSVVGSLANAQPAARMGISPDRYEVVFDERGGDTQTLMIQNLSDEEITVRVAVSHWDLDENNSLRIIPPSETSLDQWIVMNPLRVTVPPGSPQTVRWAIMPRLKPPAGEYRAMLFIEEELPPEQQGEGTRVRMKMRYGLPIYAQVGERIERAALEGINIDRDNNRIFLDLYNQGNAHLRLHGNYGIWRLDEFPGEEAALRQLRRAAGRQEPLAGVVVGTLPGTVLLPDTRRSITIDPELTQPGDYKVVLDGRMADLNIVEAFELTQPDS